ADGSLSSSALRINHLDRLHRLHAFLAADDSAFFPVYGADDVANHLVVVRTGALILAVGVGPVDPFDALGQRRPFDFPMLNAIKILSADLDNPAFAEQRDTALEIPVVGTRRPEKRADHTGVEPEPRRPAVFDLDVVILRFNVAAGVNHLTADPSE